MIVTTSALFFQRRPLPRLDIQIMSEYMLKQQWLREHRNQVCDQCAITRTECLPQKTSVTCLPCKNKKAECSRNRSFKQFRVELHSQRKPSTPPRRLPGQGTSRTRGPGPSTHSYGSRTKKSEENVPPRRGVPTARSTANFVYLPQDVAVSRASVKPPSLPPASPLRFKDHPETAGTSTHNSMDTQSLHTQTQRQALEPHLHTHQTRVPVEEHVPNRIATLELENATLRAQLLDKDGIIDKFYKKQEISDIELQKIKRTRLHEYLHIGANRHCLQTTISRWNAGKISDSDFGTRMDEHLTVLDDLASRHIEDFPTDYEDGIQLMTNYGAQASHCEHDDDYLEIGLTSGGCGRK
ncbi:hypothetical protein ARMSODRAFT_73486 [Armillaria solidipes]|uniref:Uncharacterized protein n=1 Tax=Armillaria solidipes TaxID=1076256 RepID=A0A2H3BZ85_9AGAR|nr:hypothetical protein ARMSODRAFT_73486 [Armillaria solidipes]